MATLYIMYISFSIYHYYLPTIIISDMSFSFLFSPRSVDAAGMFGGWLVHFRGKIEKYSFEDLLKIILADHPQET